MENSGKELLQETLNNLPVLGINENVCIALSGGLDSTTLVYLLVQKYGKDRVKALSFDFGQRHRIELDMAKKTADTLGIEYNNYKLDYLQEIAKDVSALISESELKPKTAEENSGDPQVNTYVPWRNAQFAYITAAYAEAKNCRYIFQGLNAVDAYGYFDTSVEFVDSINNTLNLNRQHPLTLITPFVEMYKEDELVMAKELSDIVGYDILESTWSCYNGDDGSGKECGLVGHCNTCEEKIKGYVLAGFDNTAIMKRFKVESEDQLNSFRKLI